jgi:hypothetical protein
LDKNEGFRLSNIIPFHYNIARLIAAGKSFQSKIYKDAPGGHRFNRIDTTLARGLAQGD